MLAYNMQFPGKPPGTPAALFGAYAVPDAHLNRDNAGLAFKMHDILHKTAIQTPDAAGRRMKVDRR
jgi:hypothetical protein